MPSAVMPSGFATLPVRADAPVAAPAAIDVSAPAADPSAAASGFAALAPAEELLADTAADASTADPVSDGETSEQLDTNTADTGLAAEQWLMHMLDQQLAQVQARDAQPAITQVLAPESNSPGTAQATTVSSAQIPATTANTDDAQPVITPVAVSTIATNSEQPAAAAPSSKTDAALTMDTNRQLPTATKFSAPVAQAKIADAGAAKQNIEPADKPAEQGASQPQPAANPLPSSLSQQPANQAITAQALGSHLSNIQTSASPATAQPAGVATDSPTADATLRLQTPEAKWGEQLVHALRDRVHVQLQQQMQNATIRLDPPELGSLEIFLSHESGRLTVQISASQADVARLLQSTSDRLRQDLAGPQFSQVDVYTSSDSQNGQQRSRQQGLMFGGDQPIAAASAALTTNASTESSQRGKPTHAGNLLVSV